MFHWGTTRRNIEGVSFGLRSLFSPPLSIVDVEEKTATLSFSLLDHLSKDQLSVRPTPHSWLSAQLAGLRRWFLCFNQPCATTPEGERAGGKACKTIFSTTATFAKASHVCLTRRYWRGRICLSRMTGAAFSVLRSLRVHTVSLFK
jgi:hypothetical protein